MLVRILPFRQQSWVPAQRNRLISRPASVSVHHLDMTLRVHVCCSKQQPLRLSPCQHTRAFRKRVAGGAPSVCIAKALSGPAAGKRLPHPSSGCGPSRIIALR